MAERFFSWVFIIIAGINLSLGKQAYMEFDLAIAIFLRLVALRRAIQ